MTAAKLVGVVLVLSLGLAASRVNDWRPKIFQTFANNEDARKLLDAGMLLNPDPKSDVEEDPKYSSLFNGPVAQPHVACFACKLLIDVANEAVDNGETYEDVKEDLVSLCLDLLNNFTSYNGDVMCEGIMDRFAPHIINILTIKNMTSNYFCTKINTCEEEEPIPKSGSRKRRDTNHDMHPRRPMRLTKTENPKVTPKNTHTVVHITDLHVDPKYNPGAPTVCGLPTCCRSYWEGVGSANYYGEYSCNLPVVTGRIMMDFLQTLNPDFLFYTGDTPPHSIWEETQSSQLNDSHWMTEELKARFPDKRIYPAIGNHEIHPTNLYYVPRQEIQEFNTKFADWWRDLAGFSDQQMDTMRYSGYYVIRQGTLWIIGYNTNYGYTSNWYNILNEERQEWADMTQFLEENLANIRDRGEKVVMVGHHPFGTSGSNNYYSEFMSDLFLRFGEIIVLHIMGHTHSDEFRLIIDQETGEAKNVQNVGPTMGARSNNNPSVKVFTMDSNTHQVLDVDVYYVNLTKFTSADQNAEMEFLYKASEEYGMTDFTAAGWQEFADRLDVDVDLFWRYKWNENGRARMYGTCDISCWQKDMCRIRSSTWAQTKRCRELLPRADMQSAASSLSLAGVLPLAILLLSALY